MKRRIEKLTLLLKYSGSGGDEVYLDDPDLADPARLVLTRRDYDDLGAPTILRVTLEAKDQFSEPTP